jgi:hypothetical protein
MKYANCQTFLSPHLGMVYSVYTKFIIQPFLFRRYLMIPFLHRPVLIKPSKERGWSMDHLVPILDAASSTSAATRFAVRQCTVPDSLSYLRDLYFLTG